MEKEFTMLTQLKAALAAVVVLGSVTVALADNDGFDFDLYRSHAMDVLKVNEARSAPGRQTAVHLAPARRLSTPQGPTQSEVQWMERASQNY
jgi:hypothetical protein